MTNYSEYDFELKNDFRLFRLLVTFFAEKK